MKRYLVVLAFSTILVLIGIFIFRLLEIEFNIANYFFGLIVGNITGIITHIYDTESKL